MRVSIQSVRLVARMCRNGFSTDATNLHSTHEERENMKYLQRLALLRATNSDTWTNGDEWQVQNLRYGKKLCEELLEIDLSEYEPMYQVNDSRPIACRDDIKGETPSRSEILSNSGATDGAFFVAPPIPATLVQIGTKDKN